jgi:hypothetical protein
MAIHSAKLAAENTIHFLENRINRSTLENNYLNDWNRNLKTDCRQVVYWGNYYNMKKSANCL